VSYFNLGEPLTSFSSKAQISLFASSLLSRVMEGNISNMNSTVFLYSDTFISRIYGHLELPLSPIKIAVRMIYSAL